MSVSDPLPHWRPPLDDADDAPARADARAKPWVVSLAAHALIMIALGLVPRVETAADSRVTIVNRANQDVPTELFELLVETPIDLKEFDERLSEVGAPSVGLMELAAPPPIVNLSVRRLTMQPAKHSTRWRRFSASVIPADRRSILRRAGEIRTHSIFRARFFATNGSTSASAD